MQLSEVIERLSLDVFAVAGEVDVAVTGGISSDLLSYVLSAAKPGDLWITIQHHENVVAVAQVAGLAAVVLADGRQPSDGTRERASAAGVALLGSSETMFEVGARLHGLLAGDR